VTAAGGSVSQWGEEQRQAARKGVWRWLLAALGLSAAARRADARAAACDAGAVGEQRTAALLQPLEAAGWTVLHDLAIPGTRANADHVLVSPGGNVFLVDSKMRSAKWPVYGKDDQLWHGRVAMDRDMRSIRHETEMISRALDVVVQPVIAVHNAVVAGGGFVVQSVPVVPADRLVEVLRGNDGPPDAAAAWLAERAAQTLPPYLG